MLEILQRVFIGPYYIRFVKFSIDCVGFIIQLYFLNMFFHALWTRRVEDRTFRLYITLICINLLLFNTLLGQNGMIFIKILSILFLSFLYKNNISSMLTFSSLIFTIFAVSEILVSVLLSIISNTTVHEIIHNLSTYLIRAVLSKVVTFALVETLIIIFGKIAQGSIKRLIIVIQVVPLAYFSLSAILYTLMIDEDDAKTLCFALIILVIIMTSTVIVFYLIRKQIELNELEQRLIWTKKLFDKQTKHYENIQNAQEEIRIIKHDQRDFIIGLDGLLKRGCIEEAREKIGKTVEALSRYTNVTDTEIPALDAVLSFKISEAERIGIKVNSKLLIYNDVFVDQMDLALVVANAMNNAIEAVKHLPLELRKIKINIKCKAGYIVIIVENPTKSKSTLKTSKVDKKNHGFGLISIRKISEQYNGDVRFRIDERFFTITVILRNHERTLSKQ